MHCRGTSNPRSLATRWGRRGAVASVTVPCRAGPLCHVLRFVADHETQLSYTYNNGSTGPSESIQKKENTVTLVPVTTPITGDRFTYGMVMALNRGRVFSSNSPPTWETWGGHDGPTFASPLGQGSRRKVEIHPHLAVYCVSAPSRDTNQFWSETFWDPVHMSLHSLPSNLAGKQQRICFAFASHRFHREAHPQGT